MTIYTVRNLSARIVAPLLRSTGYRFGPEYYIGTTMASRTVGALIDTIGANLLADLRA